MDKLNPNKLKRPLPSGKVSVREAMAIVYASGAVGLVLSFLAGITPFILTVVYMVLFLSYSHPIVRLKSKFLIKEGTPPAGFLLSTIIGNVTAGSLVPAVILLGVFLFGFGFVVSPPFYDMQDIKEDKKFGVRTLAIVLAWKTKLEILTAFVLIFMLLTPLTYVNFSLNMIFPIITVFVSLLFLRFLFPIIVKYEYKGWLRGYKCTYVYGACFQLAFILGSLPIFY